MDDSRSTDSGDGRAGSSARSAPSAGTSASPRSPCSSRSAASPFPGTGPTSPQSFSQTGVEVFGFAAAALLITVSAALLLIVQSGRGRHPPLPLHEGTLLAVAGIWSALIVGFLMLDRPPLDLGGFTTDYGLGFGIFVELGAAAVLAVAGLRLRRLELRRPRGAARSPAAASPARSTR